ncbi:hypothetical protein HK096_007091, partial [Nowakowskiella sp. JEL0078]
MELYSPIERSHLTTVCSFQVTIRYLSNILQDQEKKLDYEIYDALRNRIISLEMHCGENLRQSIGEITTYDESDLTDEGDEDIITEVNENSFRRELQQRTQELLKSYENIEHMEEFAIIENLPQPEGSKVVSMRNSSVDLRQELLGTQLRHRNREIEDEDADSESIQMVMTHHQKLHDEMTDELVKMASALKGSNLRFAEAIKNDSEILNRAYEGLESSVSRLGREGSRLQG